MTEEVTLYHGNNGSQDFWETPPPERPGLILFRLLSRVEPRKWFPWTAIVRPGDTHINYHLSEATLEQLVQSVNDRTGWRIILSDSAEWRKPYSYGLDGVERMQLIVIDPALARPYEGI